MRRTLFILLAVLPLAACGGSSSSSTTSSSKPDQALLHPEKLTDTSPKQFSVTFHTTAGDFTMEVHRAWAPHGADRFWNLVQHQFYDGQKIFRVVPGFVVQFGISPYPDVSSAWLNADIPDDKVTQHNTRGMVSYASAGPNTRTTQIFIDLGDNSSLDRQGFAPFATVTSGMNVVGRLYSGYGDQPTPNQQQMMQQGNAYFEKAWPKLDSIESTTVSSG
jgi:peptidyl-prolyl cis-trans isomerase A (cyclophilin A)